MTQNLRDNNVKPFGRTYDGENIYLLESVSKYEESSPSFSPPTIASPAGQSTRIEVLHASDDRYRITGLYLQWLATNSSATEAPTWKNPFLTLERIKCLINKVTVCEYSNQAQILAQVSDFFKNYSKDDLYVALQKSRTETGDTLNGEQVGTSSTKDFSLDLFVLFPWLSGYIPHDIIDRLEFEVVFANNTSSVSNGSFVISNTTSNAYGSNLTYGNIRLKQCFVRHTDPVLYRSPAPVALLVPKWDLKKFDAQSWTSTTADYLNVDINQSFGRHKKCVGMSVFIQSPAMITAYNDTDCCLFYSGSTYIGFKVVSRSKTIVDLAGSSKLHERKRYAIDTTKNRYGTTLPNEVLALSTNLGKLYMFETYIDFANFKVDYNDEYPISGINNYEKDIEVVLTCESSINASCTVYCLLHYLELVGVNKNKDITMLT